MNDLMNRGLIQRRQVGVDLRDQNNPMMVVGGEDDGLGDRHPISVSGLSAHWDFYGISQLSCGSYYYSPSTTLKTRLSTASPYIVLPSGKD